MTVSMQVRVFFPLMPVLALLLCGFGAHAELTVDTVANRDRLATYVGMYNELADRRRKIIYTEHPVSARNGVLHEFVHVSDGSAAFARTDLVVDAPMPIVVRRAYHSSRGISRMFGATGWQLTIDESIASSPGGGFVYRYGNGTSIEFDRKGRFKREIDAFLSDVSKFLPKQASQIEVRTRTGLAKVFRKMGKEYRLAHVTDAFGNVQKFHYDAKQLISVTADDGASISLHYDNASRLAKIVDSTGRDVAYSYDDENQLVAALDVRDQVWTYAYDGNGWLANSATPNGVTDLEFSYDIDGRVQVLLRNGVATQFTYVDNVTTATDSLGRQTRFEASESGLTERVVNAAGSETSVSFNGQGLPARIERNDNTIADLTYRRNASGTPRVISLSSNNFAYRLGYDQLGRVIKAYAGDDSPETYKVRYTEGLSPVKVTWANGDSRRVKYDTQGHVAFYGSSIEDAVVLRRSGRTVRVLKRGRGAATLTFNDFGQLQRVTPMQGDSAEFTYDNAGFRQSTATEAGERVEYTYDATGNLLSTTLTDKQGADDRFVYGLSPHNRLEFISSGASVNEATFEYSPVGLPLKTTSLDIIGLGFEHDEIGRLTSIAPDGAERLDYSYQGGEPDIALQLDKTTSRMHMQQKEHSPFSGREVVYLQRVQPAGYGFLTYNQSIREIAPLIDPQLWSPDQHIRNMIANTKIDDLLADGGPRHVDFAKPSNRYFIPPELWAINCCFCCNFNDGIDCEIP